MTKKKPTRPRCTGTTKAGTPCPYSAKQGTDPPRCGIHRVGGGPKAGAPVGNKNAETHGYYSKPDLSAKAQAGAPANDLDAIIANLQHKCTHLSHVIDAKADDLDPLEHAQLLDLYGRLCSRIQRLIAERREREGRTDDVQDNLQDALNLVWATLGGKKKAKP